MFWRLIKAISLPDNKKAVSQLLTAFVWKTGLAALILKWAAPKPVSLRSPAFLFPSSFASKLATQPKTKKPF